MDARRSLGLLGEREAASHLERLGHQVVARNFRTRYGELDLVTVDGDCLVICEVKARTAGGRSGPALPLDAIGPAKRRRLRLMAKEFFRLERVGRQTNGIRFDAVGLIFDQQRRLLALDHIEDAF